MACSPPAPRVAKACENVVVVRVFNGRSASSSKRRWACLIELETPIYDREIHEWVPKHGYLATLNRYLSKGFGSVHFCKQDARGGSAALRTANSFRNRICYIISRRTCPVYIRAQWTSWYRRQRYCPKHRTTNHDVRELSSGKPLRLKVNCISLEFARPRPTGLENPFR